MVACSLISYLAVRGLGDGNRNVDEIVEHLSTPLVLWGWNPGNGATPIPTPRAQFLAKGKEWAAKGAVPASVHRGSSDWTATRIQGVSPKSRGK